MSPAIAPPPAPSPSRSALARHARRVRRRRRLGVLCLGAALAIGALWLWSRSARQEAGVREVVFFKSNTTVPNGDGRLRTLDVWQERGRAGVSFLSLTTSRDGLMGWGVLAPGLDGHARRLALGPGVRFADVTPYCASWHDWSWAGFTLRVRRQPLAGAGHREFVAELALPHAVLAGLSGVAGAALVGSARRLSRRGPHTCAGCGYDLTGVAGVCPECGQRRPG